jgi:hypothetical protein
MNKVIAYVLKWVRENSKQKQTNEQTTYSEFVKRNTLSRRDSPVFNKF